VQRSFDSDTDFLSHGHVSHQWEKKGTKGLSMVWPFGLCSQAKDKLRFTISELWGRNL